ncbi:MAG: hypothetical protein M3070_09385 [Actinomycetota bacterium]|nr:hypothetical protein [Actinomycetota bacterium]
MDGLPGVATRRRFIWLILGTVTLLLPGCSATAPGAPTVLSNPTASSAVTPAQLFSSPPPFPGYHWSFNGRSVAPQVVVTSAGPEHCGWEGATFLTIAWPPGTYSDTAAHARQYVRDPRGVTRTPFLLAALDLNTKLPSDAHPTGLTYLGLEIYTSDGDIDRAVYVVGGGITERWPRSDPMTLCV